MLTNINKHTLTSHEHTLIITIIIIHIIMRAIFIEKYKIEWGGQRRRKKKKRKRRSDHREAGNMGEREEERERAREREREGGRERESE